MLLEAMLAGLPIVATSVSAVPEVVADGTTGVIRGRVAGRRATPVAAALGTAGLGPRRPRAVRVGDGRRHARTSPEWRTRRSTSTARLASMQRRPFRELLTAARRPARSAIFFTSLWFKGHNNPRYAELLPRLSRLDGIPRCRLRRADPSRPPVPRVPLEPRGALSRHLRARQPRATGRCSPPTTSSIAYFTGPVVADVDDPVLHAARRRAPAAGRT